MNVIILTKNGIMQTPNLIKKNETAQAFFESLAEELLEKEEFEEIDFIDENSLYEVNEFLKYINCHIDWFVDVEVNEFENDDDE